MSFLSFIIKILIIIIIHQLLVHILHKYLPHSIKDDLRDYFPLFPEGFHFGIQLSTFQIEPDASPSNWSLWQQNPIQVSSSEISNDKKCEELNKFSDDLNNLKKINCRLLNITFSWSKLNPRQGEFDSKLLNQYRSWIIQLKKEGIEPIITLYHYEHPAWLEELGSIHNEQFIEYFTNFVEFIIRGIYDICNIYITIHNPFSYIFKSYLLGSSPPGRIGQSKIEMAQTAFKALSHLYLCHVSAYKIIKKNSPSAKISLSQDISTFLPRHSHSLIEAFLAFILNSHIGYGLKPFRTGYLQILFKKIQIPDIQETLGFIAVTQSFDFYISWNANEWSTFIVNDNKKAKIPFITTGETFNAVSDSGYGMNPSSLAMAIQYLNTYFNRQKLQIYVVEHGIADAQIIDSKRQWFLKQTLIHLSTIANSGVPVKVYVLKSFLDGYEYSDQDLRYGLYSVDKKTMERTERKSADLYREIILSQCANT